MKKISKITQYLNGFQQYDNVPKFKEQWLLQNISQKVESFNKNGSMHSQLKHGQNTMNSLPNRKMISYILFKK